jgi:hypothetical protein
MSIANAPSPQPINLNTLRVRRHRERRREGIRCLTVEIYEADIADATARGLLQSDGDTRNVLDAWYASHLSDAALRWLVDNKVVKPEERGDAGAILRSISAWLEQAGRQIENGSNALHAPTDDPRRGDMANSHRRRAANSERAGQYWNCYNF